MASMSPPNVPGVSQKLPLICMSLRFLRLCLAASLAAVLTARAQTPTPAPAVAASDPLVGPIKMPDADIDTVFGALEGLTGKTIFRPQALPTATYNIRIDKDTPTSRAILYILTSLELNGIGIMPLDDHAMKAVDLRFARTEAPELITGSALDLPPSGKVATKIFILNFLRVNELVQQIQGMLTPNIGGIQSVVQLPNANAALITDTVTNLQRIETLLKQVDQPVTGNIQPKFYILKNGAKASDVVTRISTMIAPIRAQLGTATTFTADDRSNQIILISHPANYAFFDSIINSLDVKADPNTNNAVIALKHADATQMATLLSTLISGQNAALQRAAANSVRQGQGAAVNGGFPPGNGGVIQGFNPGQPIPQQNVFAGQAPGGFVGPVQGGPVGPVQQVQPGGVVAPTVNFNNTTGQFEANPNSGTSQFSTLLTIQPDVRTNSIVVSGTATDLVMVRSIVDQLDILLAQVSIEVIIAEVTLSDSDISGISALNLTVGTDTPAGNTGSPGGDNGRGTHIVSFGATAGAWSISSGVVNPMSFAAAMTNNGSTSKVRVLQANTILTEHGKLGDFKVQTQQPVITGVTSTPSASGALTTQQQVTYQNVGVEVKVTPLIGADGGIELNIDQTVNDISGTQIIGGDPYPIVDSREATAFINVQDGQMIVLGGLQSNQSTIGTTKMGFIWEIPILSQLLGGRNNALARRELLLFVRPHVIKPAEGTANTLKKINDNSSKKDINDFIKDESKLPTPTLLDRFVK